MALNITHEVSWEEHSGFAAIVLTANIDGELLYRRYATCVEVAGSRHQPERLSEWERKRDHLRELYDGKITTGSNAGPIA